MQVKKSMYTMIILALFITVFPAVLSTGDIIRENVVKIYVATREYDYFNPWQVQDAVMGALAMRKALVEYNEELRSKSLPELSFGIGIHQGEVLAGVMGNFELSKFGVVGDTINVAARVEALTRVHDVDLLITEEVRNQLDDRFSLKEMPAVPIKGKQEPIVTYLVEGLKSENLG